MDEHTLNTNEEHAEGISPRRDHGEVSAANGDKMYSSILPYRVYRCFCEGGEVCFMSEERLTRFVSLYSKESHHISYIKV